MFYSTAYILSLITFHHTNVVLEHTVSPRYTIFSNLLLTNPYKWIVSLSVVRDSDIPSWADFPSSKWRLTGRIKSGDVLIWSGGTGSGLSLIIEKGEALWAIAFLMGRRANRTGHSLIWNSSLIFMNYELDSVVKKILHLHNPSDQCYMFYGCFMCFFSTFNNRHNLFSFLIYIYIHIYIFIYIYIYTYTH